MLIYFTPKKREETTDFINDIKSRFEFSDLWSRWTGSTSTFKILISHTLGQNLSFVATPVVNNFARAKVNSYLQSR